MPVPLKPERPRQQVQLWQCDADDCGKRSMIWGGYKPKQCEHCGSMEITFLAYIYVEA